MTVFTITDEGLLVAHNKKQAKTMKEALERSIAKWEFIVENSNEIKDEGCADTCGLCQFCKIKNIIDEEKIDCRKCPVYGVTGEKYCWGTPFGIYQTFSQPPGEEGMRARAAKAELNFLKALRKHVR